MPQQPAQNLPGTLVTERDLLVSLKDSKYLTIITTLADAHVQNLLDGEKGDTSYSTIASDEVKDVKRRGGKLYKSDFEQIDDKTAEASKLFATSCWMSLKHLRIANLHHVPTCWQGS